MPRTKKPIPLEIGVYIGEPIYEYGHSAPTRQKAQSVRIRFRMPQKLELHQRASYYLWDPYTRLPTYLDLVVIEIENDRTFVYEVVEIASVAMWPPGPGYG